MIRLMKNIVEIFAIVYLRFKLIPRIWCVWLVLVNAACLFFIEYLEAQVVLAVTSAAVLLQAVMYQKMGFTRLLGIVHLGWIPMFAWMAGRIDTIQSDDTLTVWVGILFATNLMSLVIDLSDVVRFIRGERKPHYHWSRSVLC